MKTFWHYTKNNEFPTDNYDKLLVIRDESADEPPLVGYRYAIGYYRKDCKGWDSVENGFIEDSDNVVAWCEPPMISTLNIEKYD